MRIYKNEINGKHYISYAAAVLASLEAGFELVSNPDMTPDGEENKGQKGTFRRMVDPVFASLNGGITVEYGFISYLDTEDEIASPAEIEARA